MMKSTFTSKVLAVISLGALLFLTGGCYDDTDIRNRLDDHEARIQALEKLCAEMNTNISSLQQIIAALQNYDYVKNIAPVTENGKQIGYTISFSKSGDVTIYHGKDGKDGADGKDGVDGTDGKDGVDGNTPMIGVRQDADGVWYWTLNGEWLLDDQGEKVRALGRDGQDGKDGKDGTDGKDGKDGTDGQDGQDGQNGQDGANGADGVTPLLKIVEDYWYISYDGGETWTRLGRATGENGQNGKDGQDGKNGSNGSNGKDGKDGVDGKDGKDGKDGVDGKDGTDGKDGKDGKDGTSFFKSVTEDTKAVYLVLADGTSITLPKMKPLSITFSNTADTLEVTSQQLLKIGYRFQSMVENTHIEAISSQDISIILTVPVVTESEGVYYGEGTLNIQVSDRVDAFSKVTVFLSDSTRLLMKTYAFKQRKQQ